METTNGKGPRDRSTYVKDGRLYRRDQPKLDQDGRPLYTLDENGKKVPILEDVDITRVENPNKVPLPKTGKEWAEVTYKYAQECRNTPGVREYTNAPKTKSVLTEDNFHPAIVI